MLRDEPVELGPALEGDHLAVRVLREALEARLRGQGQVHVAVAQQEADLLRARVLKRGTCPVS